jgi:hypothetical protein
VMEAIRQTRRAETRFALDRFRGRALHARFLHYRRRLVKELYSH